MVLNKRVKIRDPGLNLFWKIPPEAVGCGIFDSVFAPKVDKDVTFGAAVYHVRMDVPVTFGDSRSNGSRDIRGADFESNERTYRSLSHKAEKRYRRFALYNN